MVHIVSVVNSFQLNNMQCVNVKNINTVITFSDIKMHVSVYRDKKYMQEQYKYVRLNIYCDEYQALNLTDVITHTTVYNECIVWNTIKQLFEIFKTKFLGEI